MPAGRGPGALWHRLALAPATSADRIPPFWQFRGGPQKYEVTGWLQIQGVRVTDEGTYRCFARNRLGEVVALASLTVFTPGEQHVLVPCSHGDVGRDVWAQCTSMAGAAGAWGCAGDAPESCCAWFGFGPGGEGDRRSGAAMSHCPHAAISDQLNLTDFSLLKPRTTPEDYRESEEDYY